MRFSPSIVRSNWWHGRAYATYGGVYIVASVLWLWLAEGVRPDRWDIAGASICLIGAAVIIAGPR
ncbi:MAG: YnfA family protein [Afipia sp.]|nr:YnfA family protein [Afipia sp.]OJW62174.1 MAG: hypothetical protein BGO65_01120 [Afipia sp. 64-13]